MRVVVQVGPQVLTTMGCLERGHSSGGGSSSSGSSSLASWRMSKTEMKPHEEEEGGVMVNDLRDRYMGKFLMKCRQW